MIMVSTNRVYYLNDSRSEPPTPTFDLLIRLVLRINSPLTPTARTSYPIGMDRHSSFLTLLPTLMINRRSCMTPIDQNKGSESKHL